MRHDKTDLHTDPREAAAYTPTEAAHYLRLPVATLRSWLLGREYRPESGRSHFPPLVRPVRRTPPLLSFSNLIEAHVLRALRTEHGISVKELRSALRFAESELGIERLLLREELCTEGGKLFLDRYGELIELSASGQFAMRCTLQQHLRRVEWKSHLATRLYPFVSALTPDDVRPIIIDPSVAFGRPVLAEFGIKTATIVERLDAGEMPDDIAADYDLPPQLIEQAVLYERAA